MEIITGAGDNFREMERLRLEKLQDLKTSYLTHLPNRLEQLRSGQLSQQEFQDWVSTNCFIVESRKHI